MTRKFKIILIVIALAILGGIAFWYFVYNKKPQTNNGGAIVPTNNNGFTPINRNTVRTSTTTAPTPTSTNTSTSTGSSATSTNGVAGKMPKLRQLITTPVSGIFASTTRVRSQASASTTIEATIARFIDRGTGHVFQTNDLNMDIEKISNTTLPKIYEGYWNKNLNAMIVRYLKDDTDSITNFYAELRLSATSTASSTTPYETKGKYISSTIDQIAISPSGDRIFTWNTESGVGVGYISTFDERNKVKLIDTPLTQVNIDWPETSTVTVTTRGSAIASGYSYSIDTRTGTMTKVLSSIRGLSAKMSRDAKNILYSVGGSAIATRIVDTKTATTTEVIFNTLADKCVWSTLRKNELYCAVPNDVQPAIYPDDWYKGKVSFVDKIWHLDTNTGEVHLIANLLTLSNQLIDATQLTLDPKENYLYFVNKNDLTPWVLDLNL
jgi:hypothetical protein